MKKTIKLLTLAFVLFATACNNDDEMDMLNSLWRNITQNEARIDALEKWCAQANTNISSLQTIVNVLESNGMVTSITPVMEGGVEIGYTITFSNHDPITIYHGKDGKDGQNGANGQNGTSPIVGVAKYTDGVYYWTLNGEWLLDADGNKLPVSGKDGANGENGQNGTNGTNGQNGITPQLKIENDYWWISYDNGNTWTQLGKAKGEDGENGQNGAKGDKGDKGDAGDSMFQSVTQDADNVYFTLTNGTVITIAKSSNSNKGKGSHNGYEYVDLGLSVKWATCNVGATYPSDCGDYYAWGETTTKTTYSWSNYKWCNGSETTLTKYCTNKNYGTVDGKTVLDPEDDAASVNMGGSWRIPTVEEWKELRDNCMWTSVLGGFLVVGPNGNQLILPYVDFVEYEKDSNSAYYCTDSTYSSTNCYSFKITDGRGGNGNNYENRPSAEIKRKERREKQVIRGVVDIK